MDLLYLLFFKVENDIEFCDIVVMFFLDNLGFMRGWLIIVVVMCVDILVCILECCNVKVEILGFIIKVWKGG